MLIRFLGMTDIFSSDASRLSQLRNNLEDFQNRCIDLATGKGSDTLYEDYEMARADILSQPELLSRMPEWVSSCRYGGQFWSLMKQTSSTYQGRREFIWDSLSPVFSYIERGLTGPTSASLESLIETCSSSAVSESWARIHQRRAIDPEGAITAARSLLESTCKYILENLDESYSDKDDLHKLYEKAASAMHLSPGQHDEQIFKQILSGCGAVVDGLAALRNSFGDAHGKSPMKVTPTSRHADLAVNLAGTISTFLIATYEERHKRNDTKL